MPEAAGFGYRRNHRRRAVPPREEEDMAQWLSSNIDPLTAEYLERE